MYRMEVIEVDGVKVDSYTANGHHLHRDAVRMDGSWAMHKRNWLRQLVCVADGMNWQAARQAFNDATCEYIIDEW